MDSKLHFCENCNKLFEPASDYCPNCGKKLLVYSSIMEDAIENSDYESKSIKTLWNRKCISIKNLVCFLSIITLITIMVFSIIQIEYLQRIKKHAEIGDPNCFIHLADIYMKGGGLGKDIDKAAELYERAAEEYYENASDGLVKAAGCYLYGIDVEKNPERAFELYREAAKLGDEEAIRRLIRLANGYSDGGNGVEQNLEKAKEVYKEIELLSNEINFDSLHEVYVRLALLGEKDAIRKLKDIAYSFENGIGVEQEYSTAFWIYDQIDSLENE